LPAPSAAVETEVTEGTRPVHIPEEEFCERVMKPQPATCQVKHEIMLERKQLPVSSSSANIGTVSYCNAGRAGIFSSGLASYDYMAGGGVVVRRPHFSFNELSDLCTALSEGSRVEGLTATLTGLSAQWSILDPSSEGFMCRSGGSEVFSSVTFSVPFCRSGVPTVSITGISPSRHNDFSWNISSMTIRLQGSAETIAIASQRWYPEECVERAKRGD